jgi:hypothetical protein
MILAGMHRRRNHGAGGKMGRLELICGAARPVDLCAFVGDLACFGNYLTIWAKKVCHYAELCDYVVVC